MLKQFMLLTAVVSLVCTAAVAPARPPQDTGSGAKSPAKSAPEVSAKVKSSMSWIAQCVMDRLAMERQTLQRTCSSI